MPSLIPGYQYDIFISYRHNDNKTLSSRLPVQTGHNGTGQGWVSEFVANLSLELESTVKGKVNIYFDENPRDGLLETHNVDESLSPKIKSLIFIPVISQTYCDTDSYAWQSEFMAFNKMAAEDRYGPAVKLLNGNVSNRVLPIRIHELDASDIKLLEIALNGKLRSIDFVFKAPGVNRPLLAHEEDPLKNANKTLYRDQINKTANAIKEIINGLKNFEGGGAEGFEKVKAKPTPSILTGPDTGARIIKSLAVLPFMNKESDPSYDFLGDGLAEEFLNSLSLLKDLKVSPRATSFQFRGPKINPMSIRQSLGVEMVLAGHFQRSGKKLSVRAALNKTDDGSIMWTGEFDSEMSGLFRSVREMIYQVADKLKVTVRDGERKRIDKPFTQDAEAYELFLQGRYYRNKSGEDLLKSAKCFQEATGLDPQFAVAHAAAAGVYSLLGFFNLVPFQEAILKSKDSAWKALDIDPTLIEAYSALAFISMCYEWNWPEAEQLFSRVLAINANHPNALDRYRFCLSQIRSNFAEAEEEPLGTVPHFLPAYALLHLGKFDDALKSAENAVGRDPNSFMAHRAVGLSYLGLERFEQAIQSLEEAATLSNRHQWLLFELMGAYSLAGRRDEAEAIMDEAMAHANILPARIYNFLFS